MAIKDGNLKTLTWLLSDLQLVDALKKAKAQTIFAPSDVAFAELYDGNEIWYMTNAQKMALVLRHVVNGTTLLAADVTKGHIKTAGGESIFLYKNKRGEVKVTNPYAPMAMRQINVVTHDVKASNGVIHVIDEVICQYTNGYC